MLSESKIVLTGASGLIGFAIAEHLLKSGAQLVAAGRDRQKLKALTSNSALDHALHVWSGDLASEEVCRQLIDFSVTAMGGIDVLINNAGTFNFCTLESVDHRKLAEILCINNVQVPAYLTRLALPYFKATSNAVVLNISSIAGLASLPGGACYAASKWAIQGFSHSIREELREMPVHVCTIAPYQVEVLRPQPESGVRTISPETMANAVALVLEYAGTSSASVDLVLH
ncbi:Short-chain dehydrogenase/reductase SDR [Candidatus Burkholderia humilis]|nr:Short-chain dehydrogenase/reductase SDR [Candidatus Burkholderia humilis]